MPSRVIRGEINASRSLERVSMLADLTFRALLVVVDDYGRFDGRTHVLRAAMFPTRPAVTDSDVEGWLDELEGAGCVQRYDVAGAPYVCLPNWSKHLSGGRRASKSRYPEPSQEILGNPRKSQEILAPSVCVKREARSVCVASPEAPTAPVARDENDPCAGLSAARLVALLAQEPDPPGATKIRWLEENLPHLVADAGRVLAEKGIEEPTQRQLSATVKSRLFAFYKQRLSRAPGSSQSGVRHVARPDATLAASKAREDEARAAQIDMACEECGARSVTAYKRRWLCAKHMPLREAPPPRREGTSDLGKAIQEALGSIRVG